MEKDIKKIIKNYNKFKKVLKQYFKNIDQKNRRKTIKGIKIK